MSTAIDLAAGDLVSDSQTGVVMDLLRERRSSSLLKRAAALHSGKGLRMRRPAASRRCCRGLMMQRTG